MRIRIIIFILALAAFTAMAAGPGVTYDTVDLVRRTPGCKDASERCAEITVSYPKITGGVSDAARDAINAHVVKAVLDGFDSEGRLPSIEANMDKFIADYKASLAEYPEFTTGWSMELTSSVVYNGPAILALSHSVSGFTGGAHPFYSTAYYNFDLGTGKLIPLSDLLAPGGKAKLDKIADKKFREQKELSPTQSLEQAGWGFPDNKFTLNDNFFIDASSLTFYFNPYEVGPWVLGDTSITLPYTEIAAAFKKDGPLGPMLSSPAAAVPDLCDPEFEAALFSCNIAGKKPKVLSLCASRDQSMLYYRFGTTGNVELTYPGDGTRLAQAFHYQVDTAGKPFIYTLEFVNSGYTYQVTQGGAAAGVKVIFPDNKKSVTLKCAPPISGGLESLGPMFDQK